MESIGRWIDSLSTPAKLGVLLLLFVLGSMGTCDATLR